MVEETKSLKEILGEIDPVKYYRPSQIAKDKLLVGFEGKNSYYRVLELIKEGKITAKNYGKRSTKYYRILGSDLQKYLSQQFK